MDSVYERVRVVDRVKSVVMISYEVDNEAQSDVLAAVMYDDSKGTSKDFIRRLTRSGITRVGMVISDTHRGVQVANLFNQCAGEDQPGDNWKMLCGGTDSFSRLIPRPDCLVPYGIYGVPIQRVFIRQARDVQSRDGRFVKPSCQLRPNLE